MSSQLLLRPLITACGLFVLAAPPLVAAAAKSAEPGFEFRKLEKRYAQAVGLEANFIQEVYQSALARTKSSQGVISLKRPLFVRWETHEPERSVMVSNGKQLWFYSPQAGEAGKGQVIVRTAKELKENPLVGLLRGTLILDKEFTVLEFKRSENSQELKLKPLKKLGDLALVELTVDSKYRIQQLNLIHHSGNSTRIRLQKQNFKAKLPTNLFQFSPPPGVDVVHSP